MMEMKRLGMMSPSTTVMPKNHSHTSRACMPEPASMSGLATSGLTGAERWARSCLVL